MTDKKILRLDAIPKGSKIYGLEPNGDKDGVVVFDHLDGMFSCCYLLDDESKIVHLSRFQPLKEHKDGYKVENIL